MMMAMSDSEIMHHLDRYHSTQGTFAWNIDSTFCTFAVDSMLTRQTEYMIHLGEEMVKMIEQRMDGINTMHGMGTGMMSNNIMIHFTTLD